jgi:hypothetical protein
MDVAFAGRTNGGTWDVESISPETIRQTLKKRYDQAEN